jgi:Na+/proline symporter
MVVASGGWVGKAMEGAGLMPPGVEPDSVFFWVADALCRPGIFGIVMAALTAALMSTVDTLITAVAAIVVNDVWRPYVRPNRPDLYYLGIARRTSIIVTMIGVALVPLFMQFDSIYSAHGAFTAAVTPPLVIALMFAVFWKRFTSAAAIATVVGGFAMVVLSIIFPELVEPFSHGVPRTKPDGTLLEYARAYKFTRAFYGLTVSAVIGVVVTLFTKPKSAEEIAGLVYDSIPHADKAYEVRRSAAMSVAVDSDDVDEQSGDSVVRLTEALRSALGASPGDSVLISDRRWWYGGLRSRHGIVAAEAADGQGACIELGPEFRDIVATRSRRIVVEFSG